MISEFEIIFLCGVMSLKNIIHVYRSIICTVEYNQCCVYSKINTYETLTHHKGGSGVCSKNNWNTECILNMYHTPIFWIIVWFINLNYLLNGESIIMGKTTKCGCKFTLLVCTGLTSNFETGFYRKKPYKNRDQTFFLL